MHNNMVAAVTRSFRLVFLCAGPGAVSETARAAGPPPPVFAWLQQRPPACGWTPYERGALAALGGGPAAQLAAAQAGGPRLCLSLRCAAEIGRASCRERV